MKIIVQVKLMLGIALMALAASPVSYAEENIRYEFAESSRSIMRVGPNQTLDQLVMQIYPEHKSLWPQLREEIRRINPGAFNRYTGNLMEGRRLRLVTIKKIREGVIREVNHVGTVVEVKGNALTTDTTGKQGRLIKDSMIYEGDRLATAQDAEVTIRMVDGAEMHLKSNSSVRITEYKMKSGFETGSRSIIDLIKGGLRKITGSIGANPLSVYRFHTGVLTIGVRGTDYVVKLCQLNDCEQSANRNDADVRMHVVVLDGLITLEDGEGVQGELALGQYAVATAQQIVQVDDSPPAQGLLDEAEKTEFDKLNPVEEKKSVRIWPWLIGGALIGL